MKKMTDEEFLKYKSECIAKLSDEERNYFYKMGNDKNIFFNRFEGYNWNILKAIFKANGIDEPDAMIMNLALDIYKYGFTSGFNSEFEALEDPFQDIDLGDEYED